MEVEFLHFPRTGHVGGRGINKGNLHLLAVECLEVGGRGNERPACAFGPGRNVERSPLGIVGSLGLYADSGLQVILILEEVGSLLEGDAAIGGIGQVEHRRNQPALGSVIGLVSIAGCLHAIARSKRPYIAQSLILRLVFNGERADRRTERFTPKHAGHFRLIGRFAAAFTATLFTALFTARSQYESGIINQECRSCLAVHHNHVDLGSSIQRKLA